MAWPTRTTVSLSFTADCGASSTTSNRGRLYSSTWNLPWPGARPLALRDILPIRRSRGTVKLPAKEP